MTTDTKNFVNYFRMTPDNRLLFGGRARFAAANPEVGCEERGHSAPSLAECFP